MAWLSNGEQCQSDSAYFVYISWLRSTGDPEVIAGSVALWLPIHAHNLYCENVFSAWLKRCDSRWLKEEHRLVETVRNTVVTWLSIPANATSDGAFYAYINWLEKGGEPSIVQLAVKNWLESELRTPHSPVAKLRSSWRQAGGAVGLFPEVPLLTKALLEQGDADHLIQWLKAGGDPLAVRDPVVAWFSQSTNLGGHDTTQLVRHWVARTGKVGLALVKSPVDCWLLANGTKVDAGYVMSEVLEVTGTGQLTEHYEAVSLRWLEHKKNAESAAALYVYRAWLRSHRNTQVVETYLLRWLQIASNVRLKKCIGIYLAYATNEPKFPDWLLHAATDYLAASGDPHEHDDSDNADIAALRAIVLNHTPFRDHDV